VELLFSIREDNIDVNIPMHFIPTLFMFLVSSFVMGQFQVHLGSRVNNGFITTPFSLNDSIQIDFGENSIPRTQMSLYYTNDISRGTQLRVGLGYRVGGQGIGVIKSLSNNPFDRSELEQLFSFRELNVIVDIRLRLIKKFYAVGGFEGALRVNRKSNSGLFVLPDEWQYWSDDELLGISQESDIFRSFAIGYRYGLGVRPFKKIGVEIVFTTYISAALRKPISVYDRKLSPNSTYLIASGKLVYYFNLGKKDQTAKVDEI